jgi:nucleotide-binding universal stress UspA family protein
MSAPEPSQVVVGFDFGKSSLAALTRAIALAERAPWHVLQIVCVIDPHFPFPAVPARHVDAGYAERVQEAIWEIVSEELVNNEVRTPLHFFVHARIGKPVDEILSVARSVGADLIMVGTHGLTGIERVMIGSVSERIAREAGCTVEIVREKTYPYVPLLELTGIAS